MLYRMDVILASSRGKGLEELIKPLHPSPHKLTVISSSGATMHTLLNKAINILAHAPNPHDYHIYIIGGYCDINERISYPLHHLRNIHNRRAQYEEFIFRENSIAAASRVTDLIERASDQIHSLHTLPIICTIPPSSLDTWNHIRLRQHKTAMLQFFPTYPQMQNNLIETILSINTNIIAINQSKHAFTPKLADTIIKKPGKNKGHRIHYSRLVDGVHPTESVKGDWARILMQAITKNRSAAMTRSLRTVTLAQSPSPDSDSESDSDIAKRRDWKF